MAKKPAASSTSGTDDFEPAGPPSPPVPRDELKHLVSRARTDKRQITRQVDLIQDYLKGLPPRQRRVVQPVLPQTDLPRKPTRP